MLKLHTNRLCSVFQKLGHRKRKQVPGIMWLFSPNQMKGAMFEPGIKLIWSKQKTLFSQNWSGNYLPWHRNNFSRKGKFCGIFWTIFWMCSMWIYIILSHLKKKRRKKNSPVRSDRLWDCHRQFSHPANFHVACRAWAIYGEWGFMGINFHP